MEGYSEMLSGAGLFAYIVIGLFMGLFAWWGYRLFKRKGKQTTMADLPSAESYESESKLVKQGEQKEPRIILGTGSYKCVCFREIKGALVADFTTIPEPIGEMYQFDPSCPISGNGYVVRQVDNGDIVDYDPREVKVETDETPDYAWHAINWEEDAIAFWTVPIKWWKNLANWYAAGVLAIVFFGVLVVLG